MSEFELDYNYGQNFPIGMNPEIYINRDLPEQYVQYLENWSPFTKIKDDIPIEKKIENVAGLN